MTLSELASTMELTTLHLLIAAGLTIALFVMALWSLRLIKKFDRRYIPFGARRVRFLLDYNDPFPVHLLPEAQRTKAASGDTVFLFLAPYCAICQPILAALPAFLRGYRESQFVAVFGENSSEMHYRIPSSVETLAMPELVSELRINMFPYALRVRSGRVVQYGIINSPDHLESVLNAPEAAEVAS